MNQSYHKENKMDEIQKVLVKVGRKDLAQKYYVKVSAQKRKKRSGPKRPKRLPKTFKRYLTDIAYITKYFTELDAPSDLVKTANELFDYKIDFQKLDSKTLSKFERDMNSWLRKSKKKIEETAKTNKNWKTRLNNLLKFPTMFKKIKPKIEELYKNEVTFAKQYDKELKAFISRVKPPSGFQKKVTTDRHGYTNISIKSDDVEIIWLISRSYSSGDLSGISGTTNFKGPDGKWKTFDRRGIESSFYGNVDNPNKDVKEQLERIEERKKKLETMIEIPGWAWKVTPKRLDEIKEKFSKGKSVTFLPRGMGIGYTVSPKRMNQFSTPVPREMSNFFGMPLYQESIDYD